MNSVHNNITLKVIANCLLMCAEIVSFLRAIGREQIKGHFTFHSLYTPLLQCSFATTGGRCFTAHGVANIQPNGKTKQCDPVLKLKTSQDKSLVAVYHADVKMKPHPAETLWTEKLTIWSMFQVRKGNQLSCLNKAAVWTQMCLLCSYKLDGVLSPAWVRSELNFNVDTHATSGLFACFMPPSICTL